MDLSLADILNRVALSQTNADCRPPEEWSPFAGKCCGIMLDEHGVPHGACTDDVSQQDCYEKYGGKECCAALGKAGNDKWWRQGSNCLFGDCECWDGGISDGAIPLKVSGEETCWDMGGKNICIVNLGQFKAGDEIDVTVTVERGSGIITESTWAKAVLMPRWTHPSYPIGSNHVNPERPPKLHWAAEWEENPPPYSGPQRFKLTLTGPETFWADANDQGTWNPWNYHRRIYYQMFYDNVEKLKSHGTWLFYFDVTRPRPEPPKPNDEKPNPYDPTEHKK